MVGLGLAAALKGSALKVAVVEGQLPASELDEAPDNRVSALSLASQRILQQVGAWRGIEACRLQPYGQMEVWEQDSFGRIAFDAASLRQPELGHIVENRVIQLALLEATLDGDNIQLLSPARASSLQSGEAGSLLLLEDGRALSAKLVVAVDGAHSWVRRQADIPLTSWDYGHHALVATVRCAEPHEAVARQIFTPRGRSPSCPCGNRISARSSGRCQRPGPRRSVSAMKSSSTASSPPRSTVGWGCARWQGAQRHPAHRPLCPRLCPRAAGAGGDAAHTIHPLAGQGSTWGCWMPPPWPSRSCAIRRRAGHRPAHQPARL